MTRNHVPTRATERYDALEAAAERLRKLNERCQLVFVGDSTRR
jgi:hypothetical protein